jgi:hypothetical protein
VFIKEMKGNIVAILFMVLSILLTFILYKAFKEQAKTPKKVIWDEIVIVYPEDRPSYTKNIDDTRIQLNIDRPDDEAVGMKDSPTEDPDEVYYY